MARSMRKIEVNPQICAISVALELHGLIVPGRGETTNKVPFGE